MSEDLSSTQQESNPIIKNFAWGAISLISVPQLIYRQFVPIKPGQTAKPLWLAGIEVAILIVLWLATWFWSDVKPLRGFLLALVACVAGIYIVEPLIVYSAGW